MVEDFLLAQLALGLDARGDVGDEAVPQGGSVGLAFGGGFALGPDDAPVGVHVPVEEPPGFERGHGMVGGFPHRRLVFGVHRGKEGRGVFAHRFRVDAADAAHAFARVGEGHVIVRCTFEDVDDAGQVAGELVEQRPLLGFAADVEECSAEKLGPTLSVAYQGDLVFHPDIVAVGMAQPVAAQERVVGPAAEVERALHRVAILGVDALQPPMRIGTRFYR